MFSTEIRKRNHVSRCITFSFSVEISFNQFLKSDGIKRKFETFVKCPGNNSFEIKTKRLNAFRKVINSFHLFAFYWIFHGSNWIGWLVDESSLWTGVCACGFCSTSLIAFINAIRFINVIPYQYQVHHSYQSRVLCARSAFACMIETM